MEKRILHFEYEPINVCSKLMVLDVDIETTKIVMVKILGGCDGNRKAVASLVRGLTLQEAIDKLKGITCGVRKTSCGDQFAIACELTLEKIKKIKEDDKKEN